MPALRPIVLVACLALAGGGAIQAATVRGRLIHANNVPAAGIAVRVVSPTLGPSPFVHSGADGMYYMNGIPAGAYTIEIWLSNQNALRYQILVREPLTDIPPAKVP